MCGISGLVSVMPQSPGVVLAMNNLIRHRGPDD